MNKMDLWIRSQDRMDLVKVESVILCFNKDEPDNGYSLKDKSDRWYPDILGTYKSKERALEVLDEIQKLLEPKIIIKNEGRDCVALDGTIYRTNLVSNVNSDIQQLSTYVYEMPEE